MTSFRRHVLILAFWLVSALTWAQTNSAHSSSSGTMEVIDYPMFQVGRPSEDHSHIDFFWSPTDVESSEVYRRLIKPVLMDPQSRHVINFYLLADDEEGDDEPEDAQIGALLTCIPAARMPDFVLLILEHNRDVTSIRNAETLFEASRAYGNRRESLQACLQPRVIAKVAVTSQHMRKILDSDESTVVRVDGEDVDLDDTTLEDFLELLRNP